jgi:hypothetical protein
MLSLGLNQVNNADGHYVKCRIKAHCDVHGYADCHYNVLLIGPQ